MNAKHTRWIANENLKGDGSFAGSYAIWTNTNTPVYIGEMHSKENAARIVACVNACEGMADPQVWIGMQEKEAQFAKQEIPRLAGQVDALAAEVERLRELLKDIEAHLSGGAALYPGSLIFAEDAPAIEVIRAATKS